MSEPKLTRRDIEVWERWQRTAEAHSRTLQHRRRVDSALRVAEEALRVAPRSTIMLSGGKDSTVMTHLVCKTLGANLPCASQKDDMDYPGEEEYVRKLAAEWGLELHVLYPPVSPKEWIAANAHTLLAADDIHSRAAELSKECFYEVVEAFSADYQGIFLGLRADESNARRLNRATRGRLYQKKPTPRHPDGQWVAQPLADWKGLDVYAYAVAHGIELLHVYRCVGFLHSEEPWRVRIAWWLPGSSSARGGVAWLRHYYPSLYRQLCQWLPDATMLG